MKKPSRHLLSFLAGAGALGASLMLLGMLHPDAAPARLAEGSGSMEKALVHVLEGEPFVVPPGRILVIRTLAAAEGRLQAVLKIDGQSVLTAGGQALPQEQPLELQLGLAARSGQTVTVEDADFPDPEQTGIALGFLVGT